MATFGVLIATIGRPTLQKMLDSLSPQLKLDDHLTIVFDGVKRIHCNVEKFICNVHIFEEETPLGYWGHGIRNKYASTLEKTDFVMHADDDDSYVSDAFEQLRRVCTDTKNTLYIARMVAHPHIFPIVGPRFFEGNVGTPCGITPYEYNLKATWKLCYGGDGVFYQNLSKVIGNVVWLPNIIYLVRDSKLPNSK